MRSGAASPICTSKKTLCVITGSAAAARVAQATTKRERNLDIFEDGCWWGNRRERQRGEGREGERGGKEDKEEQTVRLGSELIEYSKEAV